MAEDVLPLFLDCSVDWQKILRVVPGGLGLSYQEAGGQYFSTLVNQGIITNMPSGQNSRESLEMERMTEMILDKLRPALNFTEQIKELVTESVKQGN
jgi:hypothetical protein